MLDALETYSQNISVQQNVAIPFNNTSLDKGCSIEKSAANTINLNRCGVYEVNFDATLSTAGTSGNVQVQMAKNDVIQPQANAAATSTATGTIVSLSFSTLVQVTENNSNCCCSSPTTLRFMNVGPAATYVQANVTVRKIC
jgi:uncharacterized protein YfaQ (DUF2300 family)